MTRESCRDFSLNSPDIQTSTELMVKIVTATAPNRSTAILLVSFRFIKFPQCTRHDFLVVSGTLLLKISFSVKVMERYVTSWEYRK